MRRVCRATSQAESYNIQEGSEHADVLRAAVVDCRFPINLKRWELESIRAMTGVWITDCDSAVSVLHRVGPIKTADKRLGIEFTGMRQNIWRTKGEHIGCAMMKAGLPDLEDRTDHVRWCDTDVMIDDGLTQPMPADKLL